MSAWIVSSRHITALVDGAIRLGLIEQKDALKVGRMLTNANKRSIRARYGERDEEASRVPAYRYPVFRTPEDIDDVTLYKQVGCYDYQTCEYYGYETSTAGRFIKRMRKALVKSGIDPEKVYNTPEYDAAPWGL